MVLDRLMGLLKNPFNMVLDGYRASKKTFQGFISDQNRLVGCLIGRDDVRSTPLVYVA